MDAPNHIRSVQEQVVATDSVINDNVRAQLMTGFATVLLLVGGLGGWAATVVNGLIRLYQGLLTRRAPNPAVAGSNPAPHGYRHFSGRADRLGGSWAGKLNPNPTCDSNLIPDARAFKLATLAK